MFSSLASAFFYAGLGDAGGCIQRVARKDSGGDPSCLFRQLQLRIKETNAKYLHFRFVSGNFNWKTDLKENTFYIGTIQGSDGNAQHAITLFNKWIFGSNERTAVPLCKDGLDFCTQSEDEKKLTGRTLLFSHFTQGLLLWDTTKKQKLKRAFGTTTGLKLTGKRKRDEKKRYQRVSNKQNLGGFEQDSKKKK